jgi:SAM-dependent methyltransferase
VHADVQRHNATIEDRHWWFAARRRILRDLAREVAAGRRLRVVDVGCGTGGNSGALAGEHDVLGVDASAEAVELASARFPAARFRRETGLAGLCAAVRGADLVLLMDVIEHVEDDFELVSAVAAELAPGAHVLVTVPAHPKLWSAHDEASQHWRRYTRERLERVWQGLPLEPLCVTFCNALLAPLVRTARALRRKRPPHGTGADLAVPVAPLNAALRWTFELESPHIARALRERRSYVLGDGISLLAVLRRAEGPCAVRTKPADVPRDEHRPRTEAGQAR